MFINELSENFKDIGNISPKELLKGQALIAGEKDNFTEVDGRTFYNILKQFIKYDALRDNPKGLNDLTLYSTSDYKSMKCFIGKNNSSGYAIKDNDELVSVFSIAKSSGKAIMIDAIANGAKRLDCFARRDNQGKISGHLYSLYKWAGFSLDTDMNVGDPLEPYSAINGVSYYVNENNKVEFDNPVVVIFMKR